MFTNASSTGKCRKRKGEYCRIHNPQPAGFKESDRNKFVREALMAYRVREAKGKKPLCAEEAEQFKAEEAARQAYKAAQVKLTHDFRVADMEKNLKLTVDPKTGKKTVSVYRAGVPNPPTERGIEKDSYLTADSLAPEGRQTRTNAIFASPTMHGVARWVRGVSYLVNDWGVRELRIDPDEVYVYSVHQWERCSSRDVDDTEARKYWETGMTLSAWMDELRKNPELDPREWELLVGESQVKAVKPVGADRVARSADVHLQGERSKDLYDLLTRGLGKRG